MARKEEKKKSKKAKDNINGGKVNPPEKIHAEIHAEQSEQIHVEIHAEQSGGEEIQENPVETQAEEEADKVVDEDLPSTKRRKKTQLNLDDDHVDDLLNWYKSQ